MLLAKFGKHCRCSIHLAHNVFRMGFIKLPAVQTSPAKYLIRFRLVFLHSASSFKRGNLTFPHKIWEMRLNNAEKMSVICSLNTQDNRAHFYPNNKASLSLKQRYTSCSMLFSLMAVSQIYRKKLRVNIPKCVIYNDLFRFLLVSLFLTNTYSVFRKLFLF